MSSSAGRMRRTWGVAAPGTMRTSVIRPEGPNRPKTATVRREIAIALRRPSLRKTLRLPGPGA